MWKDPGTAVCLLIGALLTTFALSVDFPRVAFAFQSDEATYYTLAQSLARDGDFTFERRDLARVWEEFPTGPEGIFLKRGKHASLHGSSSFPFLAWDKQPDDRDDRLYFAKSFIYPLFAAPFVLVFGTNGFLLLHALLLTLDLLAAYALLRARSSTAASLTYAIVFFFASAAPVYFVWLTPELFNLSLTLLGLFLWCYKEVAPPLEDATTAATAGFHRTASAARASRLATVSIGWSRFLRSPASTYAAAILIGIAAFSKPTNIVVAAPLLAQALWRQQWRRLFIAGTACALVVIGLFCWNMAITGELNYQGGDRKTFYGGTGFPFQTPQTGFGAKAPGKATDAVLTDLLFSRDALLSVFPRNLVYFVFGRHTGLVPYFFPGVLSLVLFLSARGRRTSWQWLVLGTFVCGSVGLLLWVPYTYSGGGGPIGNRYFMGLYPLLLVVTPPLTSAAPAFIAQVLGGLFTAQLVLNPFYASYHPADHVKAGAYRWLPVELTLLNDLPINVTPARVRQPLAGTPPATAYFLDDNVYPMEGEWFWTRGSARAELLVRGPAAPVDPTLPRDQWTFVSKQIDHLTLQVKTGDIANRIIVRTGAGSSDVTLEPGSEATLTVRVPAGVPYRRDPDQPTSYVYWVSIESKTGFTPIFTSGSRDSRFLGAMVRIVPSYQ
jgi:hypothetical protein